MSVQGAQGYVEDPRNDALLVDEQGKLCTKCHKPEAAGFQKGHAGYPVKTCSG